MYLILGWIVYFFIHSFLAGQTMKEFAARLHIPDTVYRLIYNILSTTGLVFLMVYGKSISTEQVLSIPGEKYIAVALVGAGLIVIGMAFRQYSLTSFMGLRSDRSPNFNTGGILHFVRHPIYSGTILMVLGYVLYIPTWPSVVTAGCIFSYLPIGIYLEEKKLLQVFGDQYRSYKKEVPMLVPRFKK
jgi:protein-S-isoprenylcysteine O-methyltransferase Ste14